MEDNMDHFGVFKTSDINLKNIEASIGTDIWYLEGFLECGEEVCVDIRKYNNGGPDSYQVSLEFPGGDMRGAELTNVFFGYEAEDIVVHVNNLLEFAEAGFKFLYSKYAR